MKDIPASDKLYRCGAGLTHFHIDPYGNLQPCIMISNLKCNITPTNSNKKGSFLTGWKEVIPRIREGKLGSGNPCRDCDKRSLCNFCPAFFKLENGAEEIHSEYLCTMGRLRFEKINEVL